MLVVLAILQLPGPASAQAAEPGIGVVAEGTMDGRGRLIVDLPAGQPAVSRESFSVTVAGQPLPTSAAPLLSDRLAMALVVDASAAAAPVLQQGLSGVVDFALGASPATRTTLVADTVPPAVVTPLQAGPSAVLPGLSGIQPRGDRQTAEALDLAVQQLPREADSPRLVVLYTAAPEVAGEAADDLVARLTAAGVVLAVVTTAGNGGPAPAYWSTVCERTGGVALDAAGSGVVDAFAQLSAALRSRYLVTLPAPDRLPAPAVVRVATPSESLTADTAIPAPARPAADSRPAVSTVVILAAVLGGLVLFADAIMALRVLIRKRRKRSAEAPPQRPPTDVPVGRRV
jgi:hypothetical protein